MAFSADLRKRGLELLRSGRYTANQVARILNVGRATLYEWDARERETGDFTPRKRKPSEKAFCNNPAIHETVIALFREHNDSTLAEYCAVVEERCGIRVSPAFMCMLLQKLNLLRKKKTSTHRNAIPKPISKRVAPSATT